MLLTPAMLAAGIGLATMCHLFMWSPFKLYTDFAITFFSTLAFFVWMVAKWHSPLGSKLQKHHTFSALASLVVVSCFLSLGIQNLWMLLTIAAIVFAALIFGFKKGKIQFVSLLQILKPADEDEEPEIPDEAISDEEDEEEETQVEQATGAPSQPQKLVDDKNIKFSSMVKR